MTPENLQALEALDASGFLLAPGETPEDFLARAGKIRETQASLEKELEETGRAELFGIVTVARQDRINPEVQEEAAEITEKLYRFSVRHVPGFYLTRGVGLLWGGCMLGDPEKFLSVFLLRNAFRKHRCFLHYSREELLSHELCHVARQPLSETTLEEYFAYQTSASFFRRTLGNCFIHDRDALLFLLPMILLPVACFLQIFTFPQLPLWPFWLLALAYPAFLLLRNAHSLRIVRKAETALRRCGITEPMPVLFRCTLPELKELPRFAISADSLQHHIAALAQREARWAVMQSRFFTPAPAGVKENAI